MNYGDGGLRGEYGLAENKMTFHLNTFNFNIPNKRLARLNHPFLKAGVGREKRKAPLIPTPLGDALSSQWGYQRNLPNVLK